MRASALFNVGWSRWYYTIGFRSADGNIERFWTAVNVETEAEKMRRGICCMVWEPWGLDAVFGGEVSALDRWLDQRGCCPVRPVVIMVCIYNETLLELFQLSKFEVSLATFKIFTVD